MSLRSFAIKPIALAALLGLAGAANASFITYDSSAAFTAALGGLTVGTDTFNDLDEGGQDASLTRSAGSIGYTVADLDDALYVTGGALSTLNGTDTLSFSSFSSPVYAIGANLFNTLDDGTLAGAGPITLTFVDGEGSHTVGFFTSTSDASFFGFRSTSAITSLTVTTGSDINFPTVDNLQLAAAVPEPETYALMLAGLGVVGWMAGRRKTRAN